MRSGRSTVSLGWGLEGRRDLGQYLQLPPGLASVGPRETGLLRQRASLRAGPAALSIHGEHAEGAWDGRLTYCRGGLRWYGQDYRAGRLSRESLTLPPTFYWTFGFLSIFISISFALREAPGPAPLKSSLHQAADPNSEFSIVDRCFFAALTLAFLTLFRLAVDVNYPFKGVRSSVLSGALNRHDA